MTSETTNTELPSYLSSPFYVGKYLTAKVIKVLPKTVVMDVANRHHGDVLGQVRWYPNWRQYCYKIDTIWYSASCLRDIADFLERTTYMHKALTKKGDKK